MIEVYKFEEDAKLPTRAFPTDAGLDVYSLVDIDIPIGETVTIDTGIAINIPSGYVGLIQDRSSLAASGLRVGAGVIDAGYNGRIKVVLHNISCQAQSLLDSADYMVVSIGAFGKRILAGDKIAQILIVPVDTTGTIETRFLWNSPRGDSGFGSTGS